MRKISANLILPISSPPLRNGIITLDEEGRILELVDTGGILREEPGLEFYQGWIVPGFILPWLRTDDSFRVEDSLKHLDRGLSLNGIKGVGLVLAQSSVSDWDLELMQGSPIKYHPVIELCPERAKDEYEIFNRGIDLVSHAWNEFNLSCSLAACLHPDCSRVKSYAGLSGYINEYSSSHMNISPPHHHASTLQDYSKGFVPSLNIFRQMLSFRSAGRFEELLPAFTHEASQAIFEDDDLGSIEPGKQPGLNLISGFLPAISLNEEQAGMILDADIEKMAEKASVKVLV